jgi:hypothetical protein
VILLAITLDFLDSFLRGSAALRDQLRALFVREAKVQFPDAKVAAAKRPVGIGSCLTQGQKHSALPAGGAGVRVRSIGERVPGFYRLASYGYGGGYYSPAASLFVPNSRLGAEVTPASAVENPGWIER